jgi:hypothetical protein
MGNSPSRSNSVGGGLALPLPDGVFNPFDRPDNPRMNFPPFVEAMANGDSPGSGPSIDALSSLYPMDFPPRQAIGTPNNHATELQGNNMAMT